jgi:uncharacterized protein YndB with AHSA1/START domain
MTGVQTVPQDVRRSLVVAAPCPAVYAALVEPDGLRGWWSARAEVSTAVGGLTRFVWSATDHTTFRIDRLVEPEAVDWTCVAQNDGQLPHPDEWVGTTVSFRLAEEGGGTRLDFVHRGLADLDCGDVCSRGWDFFLHRSLKPLVETGRGLPWRP